MRLSRKGIPFIIVAIGSLLLLLLTTQVVLCQFPFYTFEQAELHDKCWFFQCRFMHLNDVECAVMCPPELIGICIDCPEQIR